jgi:hypothetical protein
MDTRGSYDENNPLHRRIIRLTALGHAPRKVCEAAPYHYSTFQRVRHCPAGKKALIAMLNQIFTELKNKFQSGYSLRDALELMDALGFRSQKEKHELSHLYKAKIGNMGNAGFKMLMASTILLQSHWLRSPTGPYG